MGLGMGLGIGLRLPMASGMYWQCIADKWCITGIQKFGVQILCVGLLPSMFSLVQSTSSSLILGFRVRVGGPPLRKLMCVIVRSYLNYN